MTNILAHDDLRIILDGDSIDQTDQLSHHYRPGQSIKGWASFSPSSEVKIERMTIVFKATLYSGLNDNQSSYGCVRTQNQNLFRHEKVIFEGPHKVSPRAHGWSFEFQIPEKIKVPFVPEPQSIPPTWDVLQVPRIVYSLRLCVNPNHKTRFMEIERPVNVWTFDHHELPPPTPTTFKLLDPTQKPSWRTALARRRSSAVSIKQQQDVNISISMPSKLGAWQKFSIHLLCTGTSESTFTLNACELALKAQVGYSAVASHNPSPTAELTQPKENIHICRFKLLGRGLETPLDNTPVLVKRDMQLVDMTRGDASMIVPNFAISYFRLDYMVQVTVQLVDGTSGDVVDRRVEVPLEIYPGGLVEEEQRGEDAPPAFHEVAAPPGYEFEDGWQSSITTSPAYTVSV